MPRYGVILFSFLLLLLSGCLEYRETMQLNRDGSGNITMSIGLDYSLMDLAKPDTLEGMSESEIREHFAGAEGIDVTGSRTYTERGIQWIEVDLDFQSLDALESAASDGQIPGFFGQISFMRTPEGTLRYARSVEFNEETMENEALGLKLLEAMFSRYYWEYEVRFPGPVLEANVSQESIDQEKQTVRWSFSLSSLMGGQQLMTATVEEQPHPPWVLYGIGGIIGIGILVAILLRI